MLSAIAIVPSAPVMVPQLVGSAAAETSELRAAVLAAASILPQRWIAVGVGPDDAVFGPEAAGTFAGFGVDVPVRLSPTSSGPAADLPLCALIAGWIRGAADPSAGVEVRVCATTHPVEVAVAVGRRLRDQIDESDEPVGVLIVADGANTLSPPAPGGYEPDSLGVQQALDDALACGDVAALTALPDAVVGRVAYQVLAGLTGSDPVATHEIYRAAPYGVGYFAGTWSPVTGGSAP
ncbi:hypothetical protein M1247_09250 [Mycobacterium sp. 21AC1]|uniref:hypothetical protein n=1 Tax=[Mycobacterium] appelbergii TaxID=2939269 RepID=UPI00293928CD|nr:hypothetical protein [Mycobacterium sp. 21AC1]MDV3125092.1 hypothetical protein [Mycobacterium sp. 21AC1]